MGFVTFATEEEASGYTNGHVVQRGVRGGHRDWSFVNPLLASSSTVHDGGRTWDLCEAVPGVRTRGPGSGWRVFVERGLNEGGGSNVEWMLATKRLGEDLHEIDVLLPPHATGALRKWSAIFLSRLPPVAHRCTQGMGMFAAHAWELYGDAGPARGMAVEICTRRYASERHTVQCPAALLHEVCHIYHALFAERVDPILAAAFDSALQNNLWERPPDVLGRPGSLRLEADVDDGDVGGRSGGGENPYRPTPHEYFATCCEAYFSSARFYSAVYPYVAAELHAYDPIGELMVELAFEDREGAGEDRAARPSLAQFPSIWTAELSSVFKAHGKKIKREIEKLDEVERIDIDKLEAMYIAIFDAAQVNQEDEGARQKRHSMLRAAFAVADVDKNGAMSHSEFVAWLTFLENQGLGGSNGPKLSPRRSAQDRASKAAAPEAVARRVADADALRAQFRAQALPSITALNASGGGGLDSAFARIAADRRVRLVLANPDPNTWGGLGTRPDTADPRRLRPQTPLARPTSAVSREARAVGAAQAETLEIVTEAAPSGEHERVIYDRGAGIPRTPPRPARVANRPGNRVSFVASS